MAMNFSYGDYDAYLAQQVEDYMTECVPTEVGRKGDTFINCQECTDDKCEYWAEYNLDGVA